MSATMRFNRKTKKWERTPDEHRSARTKHIKLDPMLLELQRKRSKVKPPIGLLDAALKNVKKFRDSDGVEASEKHRLDTVIIPALMNTIAWSK